MGFCKETASSWMLLGYVVLMFKIVVPLILIIMGMIDLGKAVSDSKEDAINKSVSVLIKRFIAAIVIFFIPTIISVIFGSLSLISEKNDYNVCIQCITHIDGAITSSDETVNGKSCRNIATGNYGLPYSSYTTGY